MLHYHVFFSDSRQRPAPIRQLGAHVRETRRMGAAAGATLHGNRMRR